MRRLPPRPVLAACVLAGAALTTGCTSGNPASTAPTISPTTLTSSEPNSAPPVSSSAAQSSTSGRTSSPTSSPSTPHATEFNPPGDIPDDAVFVDHRVPGSRVHFVVPEGWARSTVGAVTTYTDKYNSVSIEVLSAPDPPTVASVRSRDVPALRRRVANFAFLDVTTATRRHGTAVEVTYLQDSAPNPVTGKVVRDAVERFAFWHAGEEALLSLSGPQNADNVDPWQVVSDSLQWR